MRIPRAENCAIIDRNLRAVPCRAATWPPTNTFRNRRERTRPPCWGRIFQILIQIHACCLQRRNHPKARALRRETPKLTVKTRTSTCKYTPGTIPDAAFVMISSHHRVTIMATTPPQKNSSVLSLELPNHSSTRTAQRRAHRDFPVALHASGHKQTRNVCACDQEHNSAATAVIHKPRSGILHRRP